MHSLSHSTRRCVNLVCIIHVCMARACAHWPSVTSNVLSSSSADLLSLWSPPKMQVRLLTMLLLSATRSAIAIPIQAQHWRSAELRASYTRTRYMSGRPDILPYLPRVASSKLVSSSLERWRMWVIFVVLWEYLNRITSFANKICKNF